ncbi:MAG: nucleoside-diphosphate kinase [Bacteroidia bacterium]|nr:nucleoside-diphosphate kinase [Bacteroidia bacterium]
MPGKITFTMVKPEATTSGLAAKILSMITDSGFRIIALKMIRLSKEQASAFYEVHKDRPFYNDLVEYMISGPVIAAILRKDNAVEDYRRMMGATDPAKADEGTIRKLFATSIQSNAIHGSDSDENAITESNFFFPEIERFY